MATAITTLPNEGVLVSDNVREVTTIKMTQSSLSFDADEDDIFFTETVWYNVIVLCVNILAIFLNGIVIYIVARYREMRNTVTLCFVNLAITDITLVLSQMIGPLRSITGFDVNKIFGCGNVYYLHVVTIFATGMTMTFLAFDRYRIIAKPLKSIKNRTSMKIMLSFVAIWLLSFAVYFYIPLVRVDVGTHCTNRYKNIDQAVGDKLFHTSKALMHYFIPIVLAGFFYVRIYIIVRRSMVPGDAFSTTTVGKGDQSLRNRRLRGIRIAALVLVLYMICFLPSTFLSLWRTWDPYFPRDKFYVYHLATGLFAKMNTVLSPFMYALSANSFKAKLRQIFCCNMSTCNNQYTSESKVTYTSKEPQSDSGENLNPSFKSIE